MHRAFNKGFKSRKRFTLVSQARLIFSFCVGGGKESGNIVSMYNPRYNQWKDDWNRSQDIGS